MTSIAFAPLRSLCIPAVELRVTFDAGPGRISAELSNEVWHEGMKWLGLEGFPKGMKINTDQTFRNDIPCHYASYHEASQIMITLWVPQAGITFMVVMENWSEYLITKRSHICCTDYFWQGHIPSNQNLQPHEYGNTLGLDAIIDDLSWQEKCGTRIAPSR